MTDWMPREGSDVCALSKSWVCLTGRDRLEKASGGPVDDGYPFSSLSRRSSSRSTASRIRSDRFSPGLQAASIRASVPAGKRPGVCSSLIRGLPTPGRVSDITISAKATIFLISPIDRQIDITYVDDIRYGGKAVVQHEIKTRTNRFGGTSHSTLCGRTNRACSDGMNIASASDQVTCKFCLKLMAAQVLA